MLFSEWNTEPETVAAEGGADCLCGKILKRYWPVFAVIGAIAGWAPSAAIAQDDMVLDQVACTVPDALVAFHSPLTRLGEAIKHDRVIRVIAIGSSSTEGQGASNKQAAYPERFDREMDRLYPGKDFQVVNLGKGGELADHMLVRLQRDVIPQRPALVLWQTGVNDVISGVDLKSFQVTLEAGIASMKAAGIELVLIDPQFYPRSTTVPHYEKYVSTMHAIAEAHRIPVFRRYAIMKYLIASGQHTIDKFLWRDKFHLNDISYGCLAELMAAAVKDRLLRRDAATDGPVQRASAPSNGAFDRQSTAF
jgi:lysophospholipase L1-like esterase